MREIKFRAWDKKYNKMIFTGYHLMGEVMAFNQIECYLFKTKEQDGMPTLERWNDIETMQYIGLKDKNGVEGYFDDLVQWGKTIYQIVWNDEEGIAQLLYIKGQEVFTTLRIRQLNKGIIIGNVHENPELLEAKP